MVIGLTLVAATTEAPGDALFDERQIARVALAILKLARCRVLEGCEVDGYRFHPADVDDDGQPEYVVEALEGCGSVGCATALLMKRQGRWQNMAEVLGSLRVERSRTKGFRDITLRYKEYRPGGGFDRRETRLVWDGGSRYQVFEAGTAFDAEKKTVLANAAQDASKGRLGVPPAPTTRVNDYAALLSGAERQRLEGLLAQGEQETRAQMVVAVFRSLQGETLEEYTLRVANQWRIGRAGVNDGVVLFLFMEDRKMRLEVGTGLEAVISNGVAARILRDIVAPRLQEGRVAAGIEGAVNAVYSRLGARTAQTIESGRLPGAAGATQSGSLASPPAQRAEVATLAVDGIDLSSIFECSRLPRIGGIATSGYMQKALEVAGIKNAQSVTWRRELNLARTKEAVAGLKKQIEGAKGSINIVAHSWGTVIAYIALLELESSGVRVANLFTMGSPIALLAEQVVLSSTSMTTPMVVPGFSASCVQAVVPESYRGSQIRQPTNVSAWTNFWSAKDIVAREIPVASQNIEVDRETPLQAYGPVLWEEAHAQYYDIERSASPKFDEKYQYDVYLVSRHAAETLRYIRTKIEDAPMAGRK